MRYLQEYRNGIPPIHNPACFRKYRRRQCGIYCHSDMNIYFFMPQNIANKYISKDEHLL
ncbi:hypothetical protein PROSTU_00943 [Providencia stuartii ATCC 25827]|uniref:Uncharacterized protein n=1 Tax=Providencia stuartii ATCC 25827 TaxID=471874 RepID=A0AA87CSL2_PROST|nr:hypothetical protein PROSTU_00943 [Providencia stuartii ATCC 25827]